MQKSISKRLLAGILSIVMVLSLFMTVPAKSEAANNVATFEFNVPELRNIEAGAVEMNSVTIGAGANIVAQVYNAYDITINNGKYDLDPDDVVDYTVINKITIKFEPLDINVWKAVTAAQVRLGADASNISGYDAATISVNGNYVYVTVSTTPGDIALVDGDILSLKTKIKYNQAFPTDLKGYRDLKFTLGKLTWMYSANGTGNDYTYPTAPSPATCTTSTSTDWYAVEVVLGAKAGYDFSDFADADWEITKADGRVFSIKRASVSKDMKSCVLTITHIRPTGSLGATSVNKIEYTQELSFGTNEVITASDILARLPYSFKVRVGSEEKTLALPAYAPYYWRLYAASGDELVDVTDTEGYKFEGFEVKNTSNAKQFYYAVLTDKYDPYKLADRVDYLNHTTWLRTSMYAAGIGDDYDLLKAVEGDWTTGVTVGATTLQGWVVKISINAARQTGATTTEAVAAYPAKTAPAYTFYNNYGGTWTYSMTNPYEQYGAIADDTFVWDDSNPISNTVNSTDVKYFKAYNKANYDARMISSPMVYQYYDPAENTQTTVTTGSISIDMVYPDYGVEYYETPANVAGTMGLANALYPAAYCEIEWDPMEAIVSGSNTGHSYFGKDTEFTATIYIPIKENYTINFTPEARVLGDNNTKVVVNNEEGYIAVTYAFAETDTTYFIRNVDYGANGKHYTARKLLYTDLTMPFVGCTVPRTINPTDSSARYYTFKSVTWYENGVVFDGTTFAKDKRYSAVVTFTVNGEIAANASEPKYLVGGGNLVAEPDVPTYAAIKDVKALKATKEMTITYDFGTATVGKFANVSDINIEVPNGMPAADLYKYVATQLYAEVVFEGGATGLAEVVGVYNGTVRADFAGNAAAVLEAAIRAAYPGVYAYDENKKTAQDFALTGYFEATAFAGQDAQRVNINIHVAGVKGAVKFDANGGVYAGDGIVVEQGKAYGFKYVPSQIYRKGYFFAGWYTAAEGGKRIYATSIYDGTANTLYAHWTKTFTGMVKNYTAISYSAGRLTVTATKPVTLVAGYEFSYSKDGVNWTTKTKAYAGQTTTYYFIGLEKGTYNVRVRAYRLDSAGQVVYGAWSKVTKVTVK